MRSIAQWLLVRPVLNWKQKNRSSRASHRDPRRNNQSKLSLSNLEDRNSPGEATNGVLPNLLGGAPYLDPITQMAAVVGQNAMTIGPSQAGLSAGGANAVSPLYTNPVGSTSTPSYFFGDDPEGAGGSSPVGSFAGSTIFVPTDVAHPFGSTGPVAGFDPEDDSPALPSTGSDWAPGTQSGSGTNGGGGLFNDSGPVSPPTGGSSTGSGSGNTEAGTSNPPGDSSNGAGVGTGGDPTNGTTQSGSSNETNPKPPVDNSNYDGTYQESANAANQAEDSALSVAAQSAQTAFQAEKAASEIDFQAILARTNNTLGEAQQSTDSQLQTVISNAESAYDSAGTASRNLWNEAVGRTRREVASKTAAAVDSVQAQIDRAGLARDARATESETGFAAVKAAADDRYEAGLKEIRKQFSDAKATADADYSSKTSQSSQKYANLLASSQAGLSTGMAANEVTLATRRNDLDVRYAADLSDAEELRLRQLTEVQSTREASDAQSKSALETALAEAGQSYDQIVAALRAQYESGVRDEAGASPLDFGSDASYQSILQSLRTQHDSAIETANSRYKAAVDPALQAYDASVAAADATLESALTAAEQARQGALSLADDAYASSFAIANASYDAAIQSADAAHDAAITQAEAVWNTATEAAKAERVAADEAANNAYDQSVLLADAVREAAINTAYETETKVRTDADAAFENTVETAQSTRDATVLIAREKQSAEKVAADAQFTDRTQNAERTRNAELKRVRKTWQDAYDASKESNEATKKTNQTNASEAITRAQKALEKASRNASSRLKDKMTTAQRDYEDALDAAQRNWYAAAQAFLARQSTFQGAMMSAQYTRSATAIARAQAQIDAAYATYSDDYRNFLVAQATAWRNFVQKTGDANVGLAEEMQQPLIDSVVADATAKRDLAVNNARSDLEMATTLAPRFKDLTQGIAETLATYKIEMAQATRERNTRQATAVQEREHAIAGAEQTCSDAITEAEVGRVKAHTRATYDRETAVAAADHAQAKTKNAAANAWDKAIALADQQEAHAWAEANTDYSRAAARAESLRLQSYHGALQKYVTAMNTAGDIWTSATVAAEKNFVQADKTATEAWWSATESARSTVMNTWGQAEVEWRTSVSTSWSNAMASLADAANQSARRWADAHPANRYAAFVSAWYEAWAAYVPEAAGEITRADIAETTAWVTARQAADQSAFQKARADDQSAMARAVGETNAWADSLVASQANENNAATNQAISYGQYVAETIAANDAWTTTYSTQAELAAKGKADADREWSDAISDAERANYDTIADADKEAIDTAAVAEKNATDGLADEYETLEKQESAEKAEARTSKADALRKYVEEVVNEEVRATEAEAREAREQAAAVGQAAADKMLRDANNSLNQTLAAAGAMVLAAGNKARIEAVRGINEARAARDASVRAANDSIARTAGLTRLELNTPEARSVQQGQSWLGRLGQTLGRYWEDFSNSTVGKYVTLAAIVAAGVALTFVAPWVGVTLLVVGLLGTIGNISADVYWGMNIEGKGFGEALWSSLTRDSWAGRAFGAITNHDLETFTYQGNDWEDRLSVGGELAAEVIASRLGAKFGAKGGKFLDRKFHERGWTPCFPAGTRLKTPTGWKSVEEFRVGDEIVSRAEYRPESANSVRKVTRLLTRSGRVLTLRLQGREIETTHEHPYWVVGKGWVTANALEPGDLFLTSENRTARLDEIIDCGRYATVYNLEVESDHTYFVGGEDWGFDVWSHNHNEGGGGAGSSGGKRIPEADLDASSPVRGGLYGHIDDGPKVGSGKKFTPAQRRKILEENRKRNGGELKDDRTGEIGQAPERHKKGVTPPDNEIHVDQYYPRSEGGPNSFSNVELRLRIHNLKKSDQKPGE